ncbi:hypothetical protein VNI00_006732 [Paramarasmius palmivorus]|uniref:Uncharacterized protein n=1 Tax=Paramarasmius palmivorus TaxID=297713 RepID=A0AAW0D815_9AGAR
MTVPIAGQNNPFVWMREQSDPQEFYIKSQKSNGIGGLSGPSEPTKISANGNLSGKDIVYFCEAGLFQLVVVEDIQPLNILFSTPVMVAENGTAVGDMPKSSRERCQGRKGSGKETHMKAPTSNLQNSPSETVRSTLQPSQIAGIIIGVTIATALATVGLLALRRRIKKRLKDTPSHYSFTSTSSDTNLFVTPYPHTIAFNPAGKKIVEPLDSLQRVRNSPQLQPGVPQHGAQDIRVEMDREKRAVHLNDSGWRPLPPRSDEANSSVVLMPPVYDAAV